MARTAFLGTAVLAVLLGGCATGKKGGPPPIRINADPYPSTYHPYPGALTVIRGATIFDGEGAQIDNGTIVLSDGVIQAVGGPDMPVPEGAFAIDGTGKYVTPGVIDIHSHLGDYASPGTQSLSDGNEATAPARPDVWAEPVSYTHLRAHET